MVTPLCNMVNSASLGPPCVVFVSLQCLCGRETAVYAHAPRQTSGNKNRSSVHQQSSVRFLSIPQTHIHTADCTWEENLQKGSDCPYFLCKVTGEIPRTELPAENQSLH